MTFIWLTNRELPHYFTMLLKFLNLKMHCAASNKMPTVLEYASINNLMKQILNLRKNFESIIGRFN